MSTYNDFLTEKEKIDRWINQGYFITKVTECLDGSNVEFEKENVSEKEILQVRNADARKYFSSILKQQLRKEKV